MFSALKEENAVDEFTFFAALDTPVGVLGEFLDSMKSEFFFLACNRNPDLVRPLSNKNLDTEIKSRTRGVSSTEKKRNYGTQELRIADLVILEK